MARHLDVPDDWGLRGKVAVVMGGGAAGSGVGNGRAAAILLARAGAQVIVVDRTIDLAEQTVLMIKEQGAEALALEADITRSEDCAMVVKTALDRFGRLDLLDNNVGIGSRGSVVDETQENWRRVMQVNVETMFLAAKHAIPAMIRGGGGAIVNVSSISALRPRGLTAYSASKGAVIALTRAMAVDHGTGYLAAFGAQVALARRAREGGSYLVRVSLAQTGRWVDGLGRVDGRPTPDLTLDAVQDLLANMDSPFGRLRHVVPAARLSETPAFWSRPAVPLGTHPAAWPA